MRLHAHLLQLQLLNALAYRFEYVSAIGRNLLMLVGSVFLWQTAYRGIDQVAGVAEAQMVTYAVMAVVVNAGFRVSIDNVLYPTSPGAHRRGWPPARADRVHHAAPLPGRRV